MVFCVMQALPAEYGSYLLDFLKTCKETTLMKHYELVRKSEDDLRVKPGGVRKQKLKR